jgi:hypothetical protein
VAVARHLSDLGVEKDFDVGDLLSAIPTLARPTTLTMPIVIVSVSPKGLPMASTTWATSTRFESASGMTGKPVPDSFTTAISVFGSPPTKVALSSRRSASVTRMASAPSTT